MEDFQIERGKRVVWLRSQREVEQFLIDPGS